jgi:hypothetical protein
MSWENADLREYLASHGYVVVASPDIAGSGHKLNAYGLTFDWLDWKAAGYEYNSAVITQRGDYLIVARCNAKSDEDLKLMKNTLVGMRITSR